ncbi:MAG: hypothetical protein RBR28_13830, partial [Lentimicrobium sp.]|nr:hypothetical protein [Lentimicrobium sp.]
MWNKKGCTFAFPIAGRRKRRERESLGIKKFFENISKKSCRVKNYLYFCSPKREKPVGKLKK